MAVTAVSTLIKLWTSWKVFRLFHILAKGIYVHFPTERWNDLWLLSNNVAKNVVFFLKNKIHLKLRLYDNIDAYTVKCPFSLHQNVSPAQISKYSITPNVPLIKLDYEKNCSPIQKLLFNFVVELFVFILCVVFLIKENVYIPLYHIVSYILYDRVQKFYYFTYHFNKFKIVLLYYFFWILAYSPYSYGEIAYDSVKILESRSKMKFAQTKLWILELLLLQNLYIITFK